MQDPELLKRAKALRNRMSPFEWKLWNHLSRSQLGGFKFRRQHVIDRFIVDFFCPQKALIVEVDGDTHDKQRDAWRDKINAACGFETLRFTNSDIDLAIDAVLQRILSTLEQLPDRWPRPYPSPEGEGRIC